MLCKLRNEDIDGVKMRILQQNSLFPKFMTIDSQTMDLVTHTWNCLRKDERLELFKVIGLTLAEGVNKGLADILQIDSENKPSRVVDLWECGKEEKKETAESNADKEYKSTSDSLRTSLSVTEGFQHILERRDRESLSNSREIVRSLERLLQETANPTHFLSLNNCEITLRHYEGKFFEGSKIVLQHQFLHELGRQSLDAVREKLHLEHPVNTYNNLKDNIRSPYSEKADKLSSQTQESNGEDPCEKPQRLDKLVHMLETSLFTFVIVLENKILDMVAMQELFYSSNASSLFSNMNLYFPMIPNPDQVVINLSKPTGGNQKPKNGKFTNEVHRFFKLRRAIKYIPIEEFLESKADLAIIQGFALTRGHYMPLNLTVDEEPKAFTSKKVLETYKNNLANGKMKSKNGHNHYGNHYGHNQNWHRGGGPDNHHHMAMKGGMHQLLNRHLFSSPPSNGLYQIGQQKNSSGGKDKRQEPIRGMLMTSKGAIGVKSQTGVENTGEKKETETNAATHGTQQSSPQESSAPTPAKKMLKPTSSCFYYQEKPFEGSMFAAYCENSAVEEADKSSLVLDNLSRHEETTKSAKNYNVPSKRKHADGYRSPQTYYLSRDPSEISNINLAMNEAATGTASPPSQKSNSLEHLMKTKSTQSKKGPSFELESQYKDRVKGDDRQKDYRNNPKRVNYNNHDFPKKKSSFPTSKQLDSLTNPDFSEPHHFPRIEDIIENALKPSQKEIFNDQKKQSSYASPETQSKTDSNTAKRKKHKNKGAKK